MMYHAWRRPGIYVGDSLLVALSAERLHTENRGTYVAEDEEEDVDY